MNDKAIVPAQRAELAPATALEGFTKAIAQVLLAAENPQVDPSKVRELYAIAKEMQADRARTAFRAAKARVQAKLPRITKQGLAEVVKEGKVIRRTPFARYEDIDLAIRPILAEEGFAVSFNTKPMQSGGVVCICELSHCEGHAEEQAIPLPSDQSGGKNAIQAMGSTITYAKRYLLGMILNIITVDEDDDGAGGSPQISPNTAETIRATLDAAGGDNARFLKYMGVGRFEDITEKDLPKARTYIADLKRR